MQVGITTSAIPATATDIDVSDQGLIAVVNEVIDIFSPDGEYQTGWWGRGRVATVSHIRDLFVYGDTGYRVHFFDPVSEEHDVITIKGRHIGALNTSEDGFMSCGRYCGFYGYDGKLKWEVGLIKPSNKPAHYYGYWFVPDRMSSRVAVLSKGIVTSTLDFDEPAVSVATCPDARLLAVATRRYIILYDITRPERPLEHTRIATNGNISDVAFSDTCSYLAVAGTGGAGLTILKMPDGDRSTTITKKDMKRVVWNADIIASAGINRGVFVVSLENPII